MSSTDGQRNFSGNVRSLHEAIRTAKIAAAERSDVVVDMKEAERVRLELLADELKPVFSEVPADDDQFDFVLSSGTRPRLWIDASAHISMGRDKRTYRFVRDTRLGRVVMAESPDIDRIADKVTDYVADRIVERHRMLDGDEAIALVDAKRRRTGGTYVQEESSWDGFVTGTLWFLIGALVGGGLVIAWMSDRLGG